jgi:hypothetical protein
METEGATEGAMRVDSQGGERGRCLIAKKSPTVHKITYRGAGTSRAVLFACYKVGAGCWELGAGCWVLGAGCWDVVPCTPLAARPCTPPLQFLMERREMEDVLKNHDGIMTAAHDCHDTLCSNWRHITLRTVAQNSAGKKCNTILQQTAGKCMCNGDCLFIQVLVPVQAPRKPSKRMREGHMGGGTA